MPSSLSYKGVVTIQKENMNTKRRNKINVDVPYIICPPTLPMFPLFLHVLLVLCGGGVLHHAHIIWWWCVSGDRVVIVKLW